MEILFLSKTIKIKNLYIFNRLSFEGIRMIANLFSNLEYFKLGMEQNEIRLIIQFV